MSTTYNDATTKSLRRSSRVASQSQQPTSPPVHSTPRSLTANTNPGGTSSNRLLSSPERTASPPDLCRGSTSSSHIATTPPTPPLDNSAPEVSTKRARDDKETECIEAEGDARSKRVRIREPETPCPTDSAIKINLRLDLKRIREEDVGDMDEPTNAKKIRTEASSYLPVTRKARATAASNSNGTTVAKSKSTATKGKGKGSSTAAVTITIPRTHKVHPTRGLPPNLPSPEAYRALDLMAAATNWIESSDAAGADAVFAARLCHHGGGVARYIHPKNYSEADSYAYAGQWLARIAEEKESEQQEAGFKEKEIKEKELKEEELKDREIKEKEIKEKEIKEKEVKELAELAALKEPAEHGGAAPVQEASESTASAVQETQGDVPLSSEMAIAQTHRPFEVSVLTFAAATPPSSTTSRPTAFTSSEEPREGNALQLVLDNTPTTTATAILTC
ncbi:uncharacterized protein EHS24_007565 [Apiotrichum porosum]|uniref:Uncharacterized protein n=1 Tax=Apiotrichum porosum TaxID=105984 RepID=A0A427XUS3_9TREE|nr:uncharacterized protein EHS24_007565 [Apiotrichum porosum]RSH82582.1 hypothetical protein EHS24_007565 [Apiotrichum porosum]